MVYDTDPRVTDHWAYVEYEGASYRVTGHQVTTDNGRFLVLDASRAGFGWTICHPEPPHEFVMAGESGFAIGLPNAEAAIRALLGPPQLVAVR